VSKNEERAQLVKDYLELHGDVSNQELADALGMHLGQARRARNKARWLAAAERKVLIVPTKRDGYLNAITTDPDRARPGFRSQIRQQLTRSKSLHRDSLVFGAIADKESDRAIAVAARMHAATIEAQTKVLEELLGANGTATSTAPPGVQGHLDYPGPAPTMS
jgi:hypothetical protein